MATQEISHFDEYDWLGYFWIPGATPSDKFSGRVTYSPVDGVQLEVILPAKDRAGESDVIHGVLSTGQPCTILCSFNQKHLGFVTSGAPLFRGVIWCDGIIFGGHFESMEVFSGIWIDFTNFDEFCHPVDRIDDLPYREGYIQNAAEAGFSVSVYNKANFSLWAKHGAIFHSENEVMLREVHEFFEELSSRYPNDVLMTRKSIGWGVEVCFSEKQTCEDLYATLNSLEALLSLLIYMPVRRGVVTLGFQREKDEVRLHPYPVLFSFFDMDADKIEILQKKQHHNLLPFTFSKIDFSLVCARWLSKKGGAYLLPEILASGFGKYSRHQVYAEIILLLTELEGISMKFGTRGKYSLAIDEYARDHLVAKLKSVCGQSDVSGVCEFLSDLRAEIAHVGKRRVILKRMSLLQLLQLARYLKLIVATHILTELGVSSPNIYQYQSVFSKE